MVVDIFNTTRKYNVIYADPPWRYSDRKCNGACEFHYNTMTLPEIKALPVKQLCEKDCVLFMWKHRTVPVSCPWESFTAKQVCFPAD